MPRPTRLKLIGERSVPSGTEDSRMVEDAFPAAPATVNDPQLAADILEILKRHNERISAEVAQVRQAADTASEQAQQATKAASAAVAHTDARIESTEQTLASLRTVANATGEAVTQLAASVRAKPAAEAQLRQLGATLLLLAARALEALGGRLAAAALFIVDRLPALGSLAAAAWLWGRALPSPQPSQLWVLGLWLPVVGIAFWFGHRGK